MQDVALMSRREVVREDRARLVIVGGWAFLLAFLMVADTSSADEVLFPWAWPLLLTVGALATWGWASDTTNVRWRSLSGAALQCGLAGRGISLLYGLFRDASVVATLRVMTGILVWAGLAFLVHWVWSRLLPEPIGR